MSAFDRRYLIPATLLLALAGGGWFAARFIRSRQEQPAPDPSTVAAQQVAARLARFQSSEKEIDRTFWGKEMLAEQCGRTFEVLWDSVNAATNKLEAAAAFPVGEILLADWGSPKQLADGIELLAPGVPGKTVAGSAWPAFVQSFERAGWTLECIEFRHQRFDTNPAGQPGQSGFYFSAHLTNLHRSERALVEGELSVQWSNRESNDGLRLVQKVDASHLLIKTRRGAPAFDLVYAEEISPPQKSFFIDPLIACDLDGDGLPEIILAASNRIYQRDSSGKFHSKPLCQYPPGLIFTGIIADFDGDGHPDFLCAKTEGLLLFHGSPGGKFDSPGRLVWAANPPLKDAMALACGDIDHDGDLDVFLGQYKVPTLGQILRPSYYDANDSDPAYLLLNDGHGNFTDGTTAAGLEPKRRRRTFSASFVDLNNDGHPDLMVVSDFAGLDLYQNDGHGHFTDVTSDWIPETHAFGMAHTIADFNIDGQLDFLMIGMNSPTVDRLEYAQLYRPFPGEDRLMRSRMTYGNRLYFAKNKGGFEQTRASDSIARSGWSWGGTAFDFDNDGFPDVYVANGHESKQSVRDYDPEFWLHDIYVDNAIDDTTATAYFTSKFNRTRGRGWSYGGYERNRLFLNQQGGSFIEAGHLMGVSLQEDCRNVVSADVDGDGRLDLVVTTLEVWPETKQTLRIYKNNLPNPGHWIGFHFRAGPASPSVGARVLLHWNGHRAVREIVTGDSYRSEHPASIHFGLGAATAVEEAVINWPNGRSLTLRQPAVDRYHFLESN